MTLKRMGRSKQRGRGRLAERMFQAEGAERGMFKAKEGVTGEEPGEEVLDIGDQAGLFGSSDFLLRALRGL